MNKNGYNFSKKLILDIRALLWVVTIGGLTLAFYCIHEGFTGSLPWISAMVGLPWASHATICSFYMQKSKAENTSANGDGIVYAAAAAKNFMDEYEKNKAKYTDNNSYEEECCEEYTEDYSIDSPPI